MSEGPSFLDQFWFSGGKKLKHWCLTVLAGFGEESPLIAWRRSQVSACGTNAGKSSAPGDLGANQRTGKYVGGGAAIGAVLGAIFGGGKGAAIGASRAGSA